MRNFKKLLFGILPLLVFTLLFSCKKDSEDTSNATGKNVKFTITIKDLVVSNSEVNYVSFVFGGSTADRSKSIWKVNGVVQNDTENVSLAKNDFAGTTKTYVVESNQPLKIALANMQCSSPGNYTFKVSFKAEVNGVVVRNDQDFLVGPNTDYAHRFDY